MLILSYFLIFASAIVVTLAVVCSFLVLGKKINTGVLSVMLVIAVGILLTNYGFREIDRQVVMGKEETQILFLEPLRIDGMTYEGAYLSANRDGSCEFTFSDNGVLLNSTLPATADWNFVEEGDEYYVKITSVECVTTLTQKVVGHVLHYDLYIVDDATAIVYIEH